jgi:signal transduction histidine kinase
MASRAQLVEQVIQPALRDSSSNPKVAIAFVDGLHTNGEYFMNVLREYDEKLVISGGLAGDNAEFVNTIVFTEDEIITNGAVIALLYNDDLIVNTQANFGWENIGKQLIITKAKDNVVYEIDGIKAVEIYRKYLGNEIAQQLPKTGIEFPLIIKKNGLNIARAVVGKNEDDSLVFAGNLRVGDKVTFGYGNIETIINSGSLIYNDVRSNAVESIFVYSCMARKALMGESILVELKPLSEIAPLSGIFTYGEFYSANLYSHKELLNQTMTILSLSETDEIKPTKEFSDFKNVARESSTLSALSHLISQTTLELEEINSLLELKVKNEVEKNRQKDNQMLQQSRLAQMGEMISMIAHQWRQPLTAISATAISIKMKAELDKLEKDYLLTQITNIYDYVQHLSTTIDDFRDFFKPDKNKVEVSYCDIIKGVLNIVEVSIKNRNIKLILKTTCKSKFYMYDNELKQVVLNIIKNSEDALLDNGIENPYIKIKTFTDNNNYVLEVSDNAGGISEDIIDNIFDPYFSTKTKKDGTGLGLYMSKIIIEEHCDGKLSVRNSDVGAIFRIELEQEKLSD